MYRHLVSGTDLLKSPITAKQDGNKRLLFIEPSADGLFEFVGPTRVGNSTSYLFSAVTPALTEDVADEFTFSILATDVLGNAGDSQVLVDSDANPLTFQLDGVAPVLVSPDSIELSAALYGLEGEGIPEDHILSFSFQVEESRPVDFNLEGGDGACTALGCPVVLLDGKALGTVFLESVPDDIGTQEFRYEYAVNSADFGKVQKAIPIEFRLQDEAGNTSVSVLTDQVTFDFKRPEAAACELLPEAANAQSNILYRITATEPLAGAPQLVVESTLESTLFGSLVDDSDAPLIWSWSQSAAGISAAEYTVELTGVIDLAGNHADGNLCKKVGFIDGKGPRLVSSEVNHSIFGLNDALPPGDGGILIVDIVFEEPFPVSLDGDDCGVCPELFIDGNFAAYGAPAPELYNPEEFLWGFHFQKQVIDTDWGEIQKDMELSVTWIDQAGNARSGVLDETVRFDFVRPEATDCIVLPVMLASGDMLSYSVTVSELLQAFPQVDGPDGWGLFPDYPVNGAGGYQYTWQQDSGSLSIQPSQDDLLEFSTTLLDTAGNTSEAPVCPASILVDLMVPELDGATISTEPVVYDDEFNALAAVGPGDDPGSAGHGPEPSGRPRHPGL